MRSTAATWTLLLLTRGYTQDVGWGFVHSSSVIILGISLIVASRSTYSLGRC